MNYFRNARIRMTSKWINNFERWCEATISCRIGMFWFGFSGRPVWLEWNFHGKWIEVFRMEEVWLVFWLRQNTVQMCNANNNSYDWRALCPMHSLSFKWNRLLHIHESPFKCTYAIMCPVGLQVCTPYVNQSLCEWNLLFVSPLVCHKWRNMQKRLKLPCTHLRMYLSRFSELAHIHPADCVAIYLNSAILNCVLLVLRPCLW